MPRIIRPYYGDAAFGKNGKSPSSTIYARTSSQCESTKMVTYTKSYKAPIQPNSAPQLYIRDKMRQIVLCLKAYSSKYYESSLYGTYPSAEPTFVTNRSRYISLCLRYGISVFPLSAEIDKSDDSLSLILFYDDLFFAFFDLDVVYAAIQIRGNPPISTYFRDRIKLSLKEWSDQDTILGRGVHSDPVGITLPVTGSEFTVGNLYPLRIWMSLVDFPAPPVDTGIDATTTWDIGNSVRMDGIVSVIN